MKKMTCRQLGGACDLEIYGESFDEMVEKAKAHGMEMAEMGDETHIKVMDSVKEEMNDSDAMKQWIEKVREEFDALPEL